MGSVDPPPSMSADQCVSLGRTRGCVTSNNSALVMCQRYKGDARSVDVVTTYGTCAEMALEPAEKTVLRNSGPEQKASERTACLIGGLGD